MSTDREILVYGASGFTGRCCVAALEAAGIRYRVGGRNQERLEAAAGPGCVGVRVAEASDLGEIFADASCVVSTVGPFARHGLPVLDAAIAAGAHYVDTTAEQPFMRAALTRHAAAQSAGVTALPACGVEYAPMFLGAAMLSEGPVDSYLWLDRFLPTRGSVRSMVSMAGVGPMPWPWAVQVEERQGYAVTIPGAEAVFLHPDCRTHLMLRRVEAFPIAAMWPIAKRLPPGRFADAVADRLTDPTPEQRASAAYTVVVVQGSEAVRLDGRDVYASTGRFAIQLARLLADGQAHTAGVLAVGQALDPHRALEALGLTARRVRLS